jgi:hypothetical protein
VLRVDDVENTCDSLLGAQDPATSPISQWGAVAIAVWTFSSLSRFVTRDLDESNRDLGPHSCSIYLCCGRFIGPRASERTLMKQAVGSPQRFIR